MTGMRKLYESARRWSWRNIEKIPEMKKLFSESYQKLPTEQVRYTNNKYNMVTIWHFGRSEVTETCNRSELEAVTPTIHTKYSENLKY